MDAEDLLHAAVVICRNTGCPNADQPISMHVGTTVVCGACGTAITDITSQELA